MRATRRMYLVFWAALLAATVASGWLVSLALALRRQEAGLEDLTLGAAGLLLLLVALLVLSRILFHTAQSKRKERKAA